MADNVSGDTSIGAVPCRWRRGCGRNDRSCRPGRGSCRRSATDTASSVEWCRIRRRRLDVSWLVMRRRGGIAARGRRPGCAGFAGGSRGRTPRGARRPLSGEVTAGAGRYEVGEHDVEAVDGLGAGLDQIVAVLDDRAERITVHRRPRIHWALRAAIARSGVGIVVLARGSRELVSGGELGGYVDDVDPSRACRQRRHPDALRSPGRIGHRSASGACR